MSQPSAQSAQVACPVHAEASLHPPRWAPTPVRWQHTEVGYLKSWWLAMKAIRAGYRHTIYEYATELPGQDDIVVARTPLAKFVVVRNPDIARHVLVSNQDNYAKNAEYDLLAVAFGRGLVTDLNDELWQRNRRLVQPLFAKRQVDTFAPQMTAACVAAADRWDRILASGRPVDIAAEMNYVTMDIIARTMFGIELTGKLAEQMRTDFARLLTLFGYGFLLGVARPLRWGADKMSSPRLAINALRRGAWVIAPRARWGLSRIERFIDQLIADHRSGKIERTDNLLALLIAAEDPETGYRYTDLEIRDEVMTFLGAGFETTAAALAWTWYLLSQNPEARQRLGRELDDVLGGREPTADDVDNLPWTQAVVAEAMRVYPPIMGVARMAKGDDILGDYPIKAGTSVAILMHSMHHNARVWGNPHDFNPSRFLKENLDGAQRRAQMPFGAGKRMCIASGFANFEATLIIASLAQRFELDLVPGQRLRRELTFTGGPDGELLMTLRSRG
ncbi:cytochrome P450 [Mycolicibacterium wolinskyi]|uniref:Cytochrome P450 n=1 Tax=Mycolicibacterium wolinskyi TaxID=59750 RepID=A0A132PQQ7_9MYCO|nr:cytochrome P450 [Mycolicibacterium wolinskyi]KWX24635.1 cytochrome P450 [Mycolicibacterium wolinskyi]